MAIERDVLRFDVAVEVFRGGYAGVWKINSLSAECGKKVWNSAGFARSIHPNEAEGNSSFSTTFWRRE